MIRRFFSAVSMSFAVILCLSTVFVVRAGVSQVAAFQDPAPAPVKVMQEFRGVSLGMSRDEIKKALGNSSSSTDTSEDYKFDGDNILTVHYDNDKVKAIQIAFYEDKNIPDWKDVVGDAEISESENGARHARKVVAGRNFWVSMWRNKDGSMTRITISH